MKKTSTLLLLIAVLSFALCGCGKSGKKYDSAEDMISSMEGTYRGTEKHLDYYVIINNENVIKFQMKDIIPTTIYNDTYEKFSKEEWETFSIDVLLEKHSNRIKTEAVSADVKNSTISGLWIDKDGTLYSSNGKGGYPYEKVSSESDFPTAEMKENFETFSRNLKEFEITYLTKDADNNLSEAKKSLDAKLASATKTTPTKECTASARVIADCAMDSIKYSFRYPASFELVEYLTDPIKDSYGRVATRITCNYKNKYGNEVTDVIYVILQSCTDSGQYTNMALNYIIDTGSSDMAMSGFFVANYFNVDPNYDSGKDPTYLEGIELAKNGDYEVAINKLETVKGYRSADDVIDYCQRYIKSQEYKNGVDLFANKRYSEASEKLSSLITINENGNETGYYKTQRILYLCEYYLSADSTGDSGSSNNEYQDNSSEESNTSNSSGTNDNNSSGDDSGHHNNSSTSNNSDNSISDSNNSHDNNSEPGSSDTGTGNSSSSSSSGNDGSGGNAPDTHTHNYASATCTEPKTCTICGATNGSALGHNWEEIKSTIHHEQEGHYESVKVKDGYTWYRCPVCYNEFTPLDSYYSHFDSNHSNPPMLRDSYTKGTVYDEYEDRWVVDKEAYDETVTTYKCSRCGATKQ